MPLDFVPITHSLVGFMPKAKEIRFGCVCSNYITLCLSRGAASLYITCLSVFFFFSGPWSFPPQDQISSENTSLQYVQLQELADDVVSGWQQHSQLLPDPRVLQLLSKRPHTPTTAIERGVATSLVKCILAELPEANVNRSISFLSKFGCKFHIPQSHEKVFVGNPPEESVVL